MSPFHNTVDSLWREAICEELTVDSLGDVGVYFPVVISSAVDLPWLQTQQVREKRFFKNPPTYMLGLLIFFTQIVKYYKELQ